MLISNLLVAAFGLLSLSGTDIAADSQMEEIVVTATRSEKTYKTNPYAICVLTRLDLVSETKDQLADLVSDLPGVDVSDAGQAGQKRIRIRGEEARRMALLIDGQEFVDHRGWRAAAG